MLQTVVSTDQLLRQAAEHLHKTTPVGKTELLRCGVDLGTASVIMVVLGEDGQPVACELEPCQVARDGLVVDYIGAIEIVRRLAGKLEQRLGRALTTAAIAVPPGTNTANSCTHTHIVEAAGMEVGAVLDEPTAANAVLDIRNGVVVDIGGGTTGLSVFKDGQVVYVADEATGGTHMSLVLMGRYKMEFEQVEAMKQDYARHGEVRAAVLPVIEKMASIVARHIGNQPTDEIWLVGGTSSLTGIEEVFTRVLGVKTQKPAFPVMVTPLGIAMNCTPG